MSHKISPAPHGGRLVNRMVPEAERAKRIADAAKMPSLTIGHEAIIQVEMVSSGVLSPCEGFMGQEEYQSVLKRGHLANGLAWTIPVTLAPPGAEAARVIEGLAPGQEVCLKDGKATPVAILTLSEIFEYDKAERAQGVFGTTDRAHVGVDFVYRQMGDVCLAGPIEMLQRLHWGPFERYRLEPADTWRIFHEERKWGTVVAFQTANPLHRGHEYLQKCALEIFDGLFIHPIVETTRRAYFRNEFRLKAYEVAVQTYYPKDRVVLAPLRVTMNYAGPNEAIMHAIIRRNFGCTHLILGRDHAGYRGFYDPWAAQRIFDDYSPEELGIQPIFFREAFFCARCGNMATEKTCPHPAEFRLTMSGTGVQDILRYGYIPPKEIMRPEVTQIALQGIQPKGTDEEGQALKPPGDTVKGLFPFYATHHRLGGYPREKPLAPAEMTIEDLDRALLEARERATQVYDEVYRGLAHAFDITRRIADRQRADTVQEAAERQESLIESLQEKVAAAREQVEDPFMYQDRAEAQRELEVAKRILREITEPTPPEDYADRVWNPMDYADYSI